MIVLDASVLIAALTPADEHHRAARALLTTAVDDAEDLGVNPITLAEALVNTVRRGTTDAVLTELHTLGVVEIPFPPDAARTLAGLRVSGVKMPDCCVLLTALQQRAALASFDERLLHAAAKLDLTVHGLGHSA